jgi:hypothetical protein
MPSTWRLISTFKAKPQGHVWIVADDRGRQGYFKFTVPDQWYYSGPLFANEYIAAKLAKRLGFPVAKLRLATVQGPDGNPQKGFVSIKKQAGEVTTWHDADEEVIQQPENYVNNLDMLRMLVVFDAWIVNVDRANGKNLILFRENPSDKYDWYLIDHGYTLFGPPRKWERGAWNSSLWDQLWSYYHVPKGLLRLQSSEEALEPMIRKIESVKEADIDRIISRVPKEDLGKDERSFIRRLLLYRQKRLRSIMKRWLEYSGTKEYGG